MSITRFTARLSNSDQARAIASVAKARYPDCTVCPLLFCFHQCHNVDKQTMSRLMGDIAMNGRRETVNFYSVWPPYRFRFRRRIFFEGFTSVSLAQSTLWLRKL